MTYEHLTIMYSLPRSMTQWWRWFFSHGCHSLHDPYARCQHPDELKGIVDSAQGERMFIADTSAIFFHERLRSLLPGHRRLYMLRNPRDCQVSVARELGRSPSLADQHRRLAKHSEGGEQLQYGRVTVNDLRWLSQDVTGTTYGNTLMLSHRVDVPLRRQYSNPAHVRSLFSHKDPT